MNKEILKSVLADNQVESQDTMSYPVNLNLRSLETMYSLEYEGQVNHICCISVPSSFFFPEQVGMKFYISTSRMSG